MSSQFQQIIDAEKYLREAHRALSARSIEVGKTTTGQEVAFNMLEALKQISIFAYDCYPKAREVWLAHQQGEVTGITTPTLKSVAGRWNINTEISAAAFPVSNLDDDTHSPGGLGGPLGTTITCIEAAATCLESVDIEQLPHFLRVPLRVPFDRLSQQISKAQKSSQEIQSGYHLFGSFPRSCLLVSQAYEQLLLRIENPWDDEMASRYREASKLAHQAHDQLDKLGVPFYALLIALEPPTRSVASTVSLNLPRRSLGEPAPALATSR